MPVSLGTWTFAVVAGAAAGRREYGSATEDLDPAVGVA
jgi:hypothetical protein